MEVVVHYFWNDLAGARNLIKMSLSVQRFVVESFKLNCKHVISVYVKDVGQCLVSKDVYEAIEYEKEDGVKAIQRLVPEKYRIRFGDTQVNLEEGVENSVCTQPNAVTENQAFIAFSCVVKSLRLNHSWSGLWKQFCHESFEN